MTDTQGALAGVRIVDLTDERGIYGGKLLADLGADVVRLEPPEGDPLRQRGPRSKDDPKASLWHAFFASSRRFFALDPRTQAGRYELQALINRADIVLTCEGAFGSNAFDPEIARSTRPELVIVDTTSFGREGPWRDFLAPDLVAGALGGFCATTGDADTPPLKGFGELNFMVSGAYVAIAALSALFSRHATGQGQTAEVSVHESIASCLEHVFMWYWYSDVLTIAQGKCLPRRGSLHWSNAYQVMKAQGGSVMITPTPDVESQIFWLVEEDRHEDLLDPKYYELANLPLLTERLMAILRRWVSEKDAETLFFDGQARHSPYGWVLPIEKLAQNPQLEARNWWETYNLGTVSTRGPGAPYQFSETPWKLQDYGPLKHEGGSVLHDIGWGDNS